MGYGTHTSRLVQAQERIVQEGEAPFARRAVQVDRSLQHLQLLDACRIGVIDQAESVALAFRYDCFAPYVAVAGGSIITVRGVRPGKCIARCAACCSCNGGY